MGAVFFLFFLLLLKRTRKKSISPLPTHFHRFSFSHCRTELECWSYFDAAENCEKLLLENYLTLVASLIYGPQRWCVGLARPWSRADSGHR